MNKTSTAKVICPFFVSDDVTRITCEGLIAGTVNTVRFHDKQAMNRWQWFACMQHAYGSRCELAKALQTKYCEEEKPL